MTDFEKELLTCKAISNDLNRANCLFSLLHEVTTVQDDIQRAIPSVNASVAVSRRLTNSANGIILNVSRLRGDIEPIVEHGHVDEKVETIVNAWYSVIHDYNITHKTPRAKPFLGEGRMPESTLPEDIRMQKKVVFGGIRYNPATGKLERR